MGDVLFGEIIVFGMPMLIGATLFFLLGGKTSGLMLIGLVLIFPFALFFLAVGIFPARNSPDVALQLIIIISAAIGAISGALIGFAVKKYKNGKRQE